MRIVVGLGNPGREYANTRHNIGFMVVEELGRRHGSPGWKKRFRSEIGEITVGPDKCVLVKPQTYMNLSGHATREALNWYHLPLDDLLIIADDLDLEFGVHRLRAQGSAGGHNGLASIFEQLGTNQVARLKIGIGRGPSTASAHVLSRFAPEHERQVPALVGRAADTVELWIAEGIVAAMNQANRRERDTPSSSDASTERSA